MCWYLQQLVLSGRQNGGDCGSVAEHLLGKQKAWGSVSTISSIIL